MTKLTIVKSLYKEHIKIKLFTILCKHYTLHKVEILYFLFPFLPKKVKSKAKAFFPAAKIIDMKSISMYEFECRLPECSGFTEFLHVHAANTLALLHFSVAGSILRSSNILSWSLVMK